MPSKVFITGSSGFLGQHLQQRVKGNKYLFNKGGLVSSLSEYNPDVVYHLAAEIYEEDEMFDSNIKLTYDLLEEARKCTNLKAFIYIGSSSEYGRKDHPISEIDYLNPTNLYEATKGSASLLCQAYARLYGIPVMVARPFSLYGRFEPQKRFIPTIIRSILKRKVLNISPGVHDFIHIDDFIDGLILLADKSKPGEVYNFGTGVQTSNQDLVLLIEELLKKKARKTFIDPLHSYDTDCWVADITKAKTLGWKPRSLKTGLKQVIKEIIEDSKNHIWKDKS